MTELGELLERQVSERIARLRQADAKARVQLVVCGPSSSSLRSLLARLTRDGEQDWVLEAGGKKLSVPVLLVSAKPKTNERSITSCACTWDYAVNVRNSYEVSLLLVEPQMWDRPESIRTATDTLATPIAFEGQSRRPNPLLADACSRVASRLNTSEDLLVDAVRCVWRDAQGLDTDKRSDAPWNALGYLLSLLRFSGSPLDAIYCACGLPRPSGMESKPQTAHEVLERLAEYLEEQGLETGFDELKATATGSRITEQLDGLLAHLQQSVGSGGGFNRLRTLAFRPPPGSAPPAWWLALDEALLSQLLDDVGARPRKVKLRVRCTNALNQSASTKGEPVIVADAVELEISCEGASGFQALSVSRRVVGRRAPQLVFSPAPSQNPMVVHDDNPPQHDRQLRYQAEDQGARSSPIDVISLARFSAPGLVSSPGAARMTVPVNDGSSWNQELEFESAGVRQLMIYSSPAATTIRYTSGDEEEELSPSSSISRLELPLGEERDITFTFLDTVGAEIGKIQLSISVSETPTEAPSTYFESLVLAHQRGRSRPSPVVLRDQIIRSIESEFLSTPDSWKPILLGGEQTDIRISNLDWSRGLLGRFALEFDPRFPQPTIPETLRAAREEVRRTLPKSSGALVEQRLTDDEFCGSVETYVLEYLAWLRAEPAPALWFDCLAVLEAQPNPAAGVYTAGGEPVAILLSPLHPCRLAWMCSAQRLLESSLKKSCPLVGLLDPNRSPDIGTWPIYRGAAGPSWTTFVSVPCEDAYWSLLWNSRMLDRLRSGATATLLRAIGVGPRGLQGGFTKPQSIGTLDDVSRMMPARSVLRLGLVGENEGRSTCAEGIITWSQKRFASANTSPVELHVFDARRAEDQPKNEELSNLEGDTDGRVLWYDRSKKGLPDNLDAIILDQVGVRESVLSTSPYRSPVSAGSLVRTRIRIDRDSAKWIRETRIQLTAGCSDEGLLGIASTCVAEIEQLTLTKAGASLLEFAPNHVAIGNRLDQAGLVAVASAEIDPACFARNALAHGSYLWDYELPFANGVSDQRVGYYKLAKPSNAVRRTVEAVTKLLSENPPPVNDLLAEISRRGIPILKKLASGGTQARGEIGVLLCARLLQDVFGASRYSCRLPVATGNSVAILVPVDPFASLFRKVQQSLIGSESELIRPDTLAICAHFDQDGHVTIYLTPVEIKFRESLANDASLSDWLKQAAGFGDFLRRLWSSTPPTELWGVCAKGLLAHILNYGMRIYGDEQVTGVSTDEWATRHESMLAAIYSGRAEIVVNEEGRLAVFDTSTSSRLLDLDNDGLRETLVVCRNDARAILERNLPAGSQLDQAVERWQLCGAATEVSAADEKDKGLVSLSPSSEPIASTNSHEVAAAATAAPSSATEPAPKPTTAEERGRANETPTGLVAPEAIRSTIPAEVREKVAQAFEGFIGNGQAVDSLKRDLLRALIDKPPHLPKNYLFVGNPSTGKTELARRVAAALQLPFVRVDGRTVTSREKLFELIDAELRRVGSLPREVGTLYGKPNLSYPPLIVFVDEVQLVARAVQESFLTLLESQDRTVVLERSVATLQQATHLFATTRSSELDAAFRSRCTEVYLHPYSETEVAEMLARQFPAWPPEILRKIARYGRSIPRIALELAKELETEVLVSEFQDRSLDAHLEEVRRTRGIDDNGLGHLDLNYLELLERSGPLGEQRLLSMLGSVDRERILTEVEPHLVKRLKLVQMTPKGRELTDLGRRYMAKVRKVGH